VTALGDPLTDRPDTAPWLEDAEHLAVVLESLEWQAERAVEAGVPAADLLAALWPLQARLGALVARVQEEAVVRAVGTGVWP
jgi:hypothetical protein